LNRLSADQPGMFADGFSQFLAESNNFFIAGRGSYPGAQFPDVFVCRHISPGTLAQSYVGPAASPLTYRTYPTLQARTP